MKVKFTPIFFFFFTLIIIFRLSWFAMRYQCHNFWFMNFVSKKNSQLKCWGALPTANLMVADNLHYFLIWREIFKSEIVFCYQNCSDLLWEKNCSSDGEKNLKFKAEGREFAKFLRWLEQFIQTVKGQSNFW